MNRQATGNYLYPLATVVGEHDTPLAHESSLAWLQRETSSTYTVIQGANYCVQMDAPPHSTRSCRSFQNGHTRRETATP